MKKTIISILITVPFIITALGFGAPTEVESVRDKLMRWQIGVWLSAGGTYTVWTPEHYFVLSMSGDTTDPNLYYACSQVSYHEKGITRHQVQRFRKFPGGDPTMFSEDTFTAEHGETPYTPDTTLFDPNKCIIQGGVIYDAIIENTDTYILLATCNGDRIKLFSDGRSAYLPATGGASYSYRIEEF
jgi:hypothetical protein